MSRFIVLLLAFLAAAPASAQASCPYRLFASGYFSTVHVLNSVSLFPPFAALRA